MKPIKVRVVNYGRTNFMLRWTDPITGKRKTENSGCDTIRKAHLAADAKEKTLNSRQPQGDGSKSFGDFMAEYEEFHLRGLAENSRKSGKVCLSVLSKMLEPLTIGHVTSSLVSRWVTALRKAGRSEVTIATYIRTLKAAMTWAKNAGHITELPVFPRASRSTGTKPKGRPITDKEFLEMLHAVRLCDDLADLDRRGRRTWRRFLIGLWLSGLRLEEALRLQWGPDDHKSGFNLDYSHKFPQFLIGDQKSGKQETTPLAPDFGKWILKVPESEREGFVFPLAKTRYQNVRRVDSTSKVISAIGEKSGVKVSEKKFASAHDLRRSFGLRWASRLHSPTELRSLMRHEEIGTTLAFYAQLDSQGFAEKLWESATKTATQNEKPL